MGATAATVIPEFAKTAAHVTMLQRSPTYFYCAPNRNELADRLREMGFGEGVEVEVLHRAPLGGDPVAVQVGGGVVAIRRAEARLVELDLREAAE